MTPRLKCFGVGCPLASTCWRYVAPALPYTQEYLGAPRQLGYECLDHWPVRRHDQDVLAGRIPGDHNLPTGAAPSSRGRGGNSE